MTDVGQDTTIVVFEWVLAIVVLAVVVFCERLPLASIGFRAPSWRHFAAMGGAFVVLIALLAAFAVLTHGASATSESPAQIAAIPLWFRVVVFLTAGFCEELLFRAYAIERLALFTGNLWIGSVVSLVLFTLGHVPRYGFTVALVAVGIIAAVLSALYVWTRNSGSARRCTRSSTVSGSSSHLRLRREGCSDDWGTRSPRLNGANG